MKTFVSFFIHAIVFAKLEYFKVNTLTYINLCSILDYIGFILYWDIIDYRQKAILYKPSISGDNYCS